jgi:hypothetical protein
MPTFVSSFADVNRTSFPKYTFHPNDCMRGRVEYITGIGKLRKVHMIFLIEKLQRNVRDMGKGNVTLKWISEKHGKKD